MYTHGDARALRSICGKYILGKFRRPAGQRFFRRAENWVSTGSPEDETRFNPTGEEREGGKQVYLSERSLSVRAKADCLVK